MNTAYRMLVGLLALQATWAWAAENDDNNYRGDRLSFAVKMIGTKTGADGKSEDVCIPAATTLRGMSKLEKDLKVVVHEGWSKQLDCNNKPLPLGELITLNVDKDSIANYGGSRYGLTYGGLVVPFKYHLSGDKEFAAGGTVAPYLGYRFDKNSYGYGIKLVGFLGAAGVAVEQDVNGEKKTQTLSGLSYGLGVLGTVKGNFQFGLVLGADRVSKSANYPHNGKWWAALGLGFDFAE